MADLNRIPQDPNLINPMEQALLTSEELFRHAFGYAAVGMALINPEGRMIKVNQTFCDLIGYTEDELVNLYFKEITYPEDLEKNMLLVKQTLKGERRTYQIEKRYVHKNGSIVWTILGVSLVRDAADNPLYFVAQIQDITDRKLVEQKLEESRLRYKSLVQHNPDIICMLDEHGKLISANTSTVKITGYSKEELLQRSFLPFIAVEDWKKSWELFSKAKHGEIRHTEVQVIHKQGHFVALEITFVPMITHDQLSGIYLIAKDITKRKENEAIIERLHNKNKLILSAVSDGIFGIDVNLETIFWNEAAEKFTGYAYREMMGKNAYDILKQIHHSEYVPSSTEISPLYRTLYEGIYSHITEESFHNKSGQAFPVEYTTSPMYEDGRIIGAVVTFTDITDRKRTEELLLKSEKLTIVGQIAAGVAHEIRNPLTALKGFTQFLQSGAANKQEYYEIMLAELSRIELIITEMLMLAKPQMIRYQPRNPETIIQNVVALLETQAIMNNIEFVVVIEQGLPMILCEENQLKQMFINLLKNAMESMPDGGQVDIHVRVDEAGQIRVIIKDQGCGIAPEVLERLGEPFFTTKDKGTGLGFMISYKITEEHNGNIRIDSQLGEGTVVDIALPVIGE